MAGWARISCGAGVSGRILLLGGVDLNQWSFQGLDHRRRHGAPLSPHCFPERQ